MKGNTSAAVWKRRWPACVVAALLFVLCLLAASGLAFATQPSLELDKPSSLKVTLATQEAPAVIDYGGIQVDAYLVAQAEQSQGYDTYTYAPVAGGPFAQLDVEALNKALGSGNSTEATQASHDYAQAALSAALADLQSASPSLSTAPHASMRVASAACEADFAALDSGLYLLVAHGANLSASDYATTLADGKAATLAYSATKEFAFEPVLVSLPTREGAVDQPLTTASGSGWTHNARIMLKPQVAPRMGSLEIVKSLQRFETDGTGVDSAATFVFSVQATDAQGETVYDDVVSMVFNKPGDQKVLIENKIPVGSTVTVREVYSGASYQVVGPQEKTAVIQANDVVQVSFTNTNDNTKVHGGSVTNSFAYGEGGWDLNPAYSQDAAASGN